MRSLWTSGCCMPAQKIKAPFSMILCLLRKYPQYCWEFHDRLWEALSGTNSEKRGAPSRTGGERILETLWKPQMPWIIGLGASQPYSRGKFQETLWERFRGLSGIFPEFLPESPSRTWGMAHNSTTSSKWDLFEPAVVAYQSLAQKIKTPSSMILCLLSGPK